MKGLNHVSMAVKAMLIQGLAFISKRIYKPLRICLNKV